MIDVIHYKWLYFNAAVAMSSTCPGLYCGKTLINGTIEGECGVSDSFVYDNDSC